MVEQDAIIDWASAERIHALSVDLAGEHNWELVMLESGQVTATGKWDNVGKVAATCAYAPPTRAEMMQRAEDEASLFLGLWPSQKKRSNGTRREGGACTWQGSRGYLLSYGGAQTLLRYARPMMVQVDALMGLVATFEPGFRMYWPRVDIAHKDFSRASTIWDGCLKCYLPVNGVRGAVACGVVAAGVGLMCAWRAVKRRA